MLTVSGTDAVAFRVKNRPYARRLQKLAADYGDADIEPLTRDCNRDALRQRLQEAFDIVGDLDTATKWVWDSRTVRTQRKQRPKKPLVKVAAKANSIVSHDDRVSGYRADLRPSYLDRASTKLKRQATTAAVGSMPSRSAPSVSCSSLQ